MAAHMEAFQTPQEVLAEQHQLDYLPLCDNYKREKYDQDNYHAVEIELKFAHMDISLQKLKEWKQCKKTTGDYNLVPAFLGKDKEKEAKHKVTREEKKL
ncbi:hypothetical protein Celaphus_00008427 [Cervus elaphus hippelaphus]|uniref:Uncharacterized protein n=1 Tax=Cervus elaphus hippelaphus TaxID=46360 RepID=A0A212CNQ6_CEREH|nr:hypothetical protein Celaphus_00008427 [Cervus elaphus hippelaphus]